MNCNDKISPVQTECVDIPNWFDINEFIKKETEKYVLYEIPRLISIELNRESLLEKFLDVEMKIERDSPVYWIKVFKK